MSAPIQGFAEHTIWHEIIMFQLCCEGRSWPLILASLPIRLSVLSSWSFRGFGKPQQSALNSTTLSLPFIKGLFNRREALIISIPLDDGFSYLRLLQFNDCNYMLLPQENESGRKCSILTPFTYKESQSTHGYEWKREDIWRSPASLRVQRKAKWAMKKLSLRRC